MRNIGNVFVVSINLYMLLIFTKLQILCDKKFSFLILKKMKNAFIPRCMNHRSTYYMAVPLKG